MKTNSRENPQCETGCQHFYGNEIKHQKNCHYYPESLSRMLDIANLKITQVRETLEKWNARPSLSKDPVVKRDIRKVLELIKGDQP